MDTCNFFGSDTSNGDYSSAPPVLLIASSDSAGALAQGAIEESGLRPFRVTLAEAKERLQLQASASGVWIELDRCDDEVADALGGLSAAAGRFPAIVSTRMALIDDAAALIGDAPVDLIADASSTDRIAALALARAAASAPSRLNDVSGEPGAARLRQLSDEVSRIAATLARLSAGGAAPALDKPMTPAEAGGAPAVAGDTVRQVIRARRLRSRFFDSELFADPAWDMLLDLFQAEIAQHRVPVSSLCIAAAVPPTTALRWIKTMTDAGLFMRRADPHDGRRIFVELAPVASDAMRRYFGELGRATAI